jgi:hypothetical protein
MDSRRGLHTYTHTCINAYIRTYARAVDSRRGHTYIHTNIHTNIHTYTHKYTRAVDSRRGHTYIHTYIHTNIPFIHIRAVDSRRGQKNSQNKWFPKQNQPGQDAEAVEDGQNEATPQSRLPGFPGRGGRGGDGKLPAPDDDKQGKDKKEKGQSKGL